MKILGRLLITVFVLGVLGAAGLWWYQTHRQAAADTAPPPAAARAVPVEASPVAVEPVVRTIAAVGTLDSSESVILRPEIAGRIATINFAEGTSVDKDETLFVLDDSIYEAEADQARANLELSRKNFARAEELYQKGAGTARHLDEAQAQLRVNEATLSLALTMLDKTRIRAPFGGILGLRRVSAGDYVQPGQDLVNLESIHPLKVRFRVPQTALTAVAVGQKVEIEVDAMPGRTFTGEVQALDPKLDAGTRSVTAQALIANPDSALRPGLFATVRLVVDRRDDSILVPEEAVFAEGDARHVYRIVDGTARLATVTLGHREAGRVEVTSGLEPGDTVVAAGHQKLRDGAPVMVLGAGTGGNK